MSCGSPLAPPASTEPEDNGDRCLKCAEDGLRAYGPNYQQFVRDMRAANIDVRDYHGRSFYKGPGVVVEDIQDCIRATTVPVQWDNMGLDWVVYPK